MENFNSSEEKRRHKRADMLISVQYKNLKKIGEPSLGSISRNISEGGVCFKSNSFISLACRLVLEITLPALPKPIKAISKVAWIKKIPVGDQYELGNQFLEMTKEDRMHIANFMNKILEVSTGQATS